MRRRVLQVQLTLNMVAQGSMSPGGVVCRYASGVGSGMSDMNEREDGRL